MKYCEQCRTEVQDDNKFCSKCGAKCESDDWSAIIKVESQNSPNL